MIHQVIMFFKTLQKRLGNSDQSSKYREDAVFQWQRGMLWNLKQILSDKVRVLKGTGYHLQNQFIQFNLKLRKPQKTRPPSSWVYGLNPNTLGSCEPYWPSGKPTWQTENPPCSIRNTSSFIDLFSWPAIWIYKTDKIITLCCNLHFVVNQFIL